MQIRRYGPRIAAETTVDADNEAAARNAGFRALAGYIFGGNHESAIIAMTAPVTQEPSDARSGQKIAMTAPVAQAVAADDAWVIRFFMPADHSMETLPAPNDPAVKLVTVPAETVAVLRFTGDRGPEAVASHTADLLTHYRTPLWNPTARRSHGSTTRPGPSRCCAATRSLCR